ncbi:MAG TPA: enolase C-terminal domain-like protein [Terriglobia bacterium]|nr:enolase C-terminal domain-like protein [Terriglobia bacterium]
MNGIERVEVFAYTIPTDFPESDGTLEWDKTTIVIVETTGGGATGIGYTYGDTAVAALIEGKLAGTIAGADPIDIQGSWMAMVRSIRNLGLPGVASMAISAVDVSLWDLKAKLLRLPLAKLLGLVRNGIPVYGSGGFTSYSNKQLREQLGGWASEGIPRVKMKIGREPARDPQRVEEARKAIGNETELFVDANGAYSRKQALDLAEEFRRYGVRWFEEPVSSDDLEGLRLMRDRAPAGMNIAAGEYGYNLQYFRRMLEAGAVDVLQADVTRCGGITGFLGVGALCDAGEVPLSGHTAPALHLALGCSLPRMCHLEYFHDHVRIEEMLFEGIVRPRGGVLYPDLSRLGLGLELKRSAAERYAA